MVVLDERHHTFLQALMKRGPLAEVESKKMFRELFNMADGASPSLSGKLSHNAENFKCGTKVVVTLIFKVED